MFMYIIPHRTQGKCNPHRYSDTHIRTRFDYRTERNLYGNTNQDMSSQ